MKSKKIKKGNIVSIPILKKKKATWNTTDFFSSIGVRLNRYKSISINLQVPKG